MLALFAAGGIEFDPLNPGQTTVLASAPGFTQTGAASSQVTVSAPGITLFSLPVSVGSGLMYGSMSGQLGAGGHNGVHRPAHQQQSRRDAAVGDVE